MPEDFDVRGSVANVWARPSAPEPPRRRFDGDRYVRGGLIGEGGMGRVFIARDRLLERDVALKECRPERGAAGRRRLEHEARITARLEHPGILPVYDAGDDEQGSSWYVMRLVRGEPLTALLRQPELAQRLGALRPLLAVAEAVAFAHSKGVIHRDLKPENLLVGAFGETLVADWGLATELLDGRAREAGRVGSPGYMSPEQEAGGWPSPASDVYSLGVVLFEAATGADPMQLGAGVRSDSARTLLRDAGAPPALQGIVRRATAADPQDRYGDCAALAEDLERLLDGRRVHAHSYSAAELLGRLVALWRAPLLVGAVAFVALVVAIVTGFAQTQAQKNRAEAERARAEEERGRAQLSAGTALLEQARAALREGDRAHADTLAQRALTFAELPGARGLLAFQGLRGRPELLAESAVPDGCEQTLLTEEGLLCLGAGTITLWSPEGEVRWTMDADGSARLLGAGPSVMAAGGVLRRVNLSTGSFDGEWEVSNAEGAVASRWGLVAWSNALMFALDDDGATPLRWCDGAADVAGLTAGDDAFLVVCSDMRAGLVDPRLADAPMKDTLATPFALDGLESLVHLSGSLYALMGAGGQVTVLDAATERVVRRWPVTDHSLVQGVRHHGGLLAVRSERGLVFAVDPTSGAVDRLPTEGARDLRFTQEGTLQVVGVTQQRWALRQSAAGWQIPIVGGAGPVAVHEGRVAVGHGTGHVTQWSPDAGPPETVEALDGVIKGLGWWNGDLYAAASVTSAPSAARIRGTLVTGLEQSAPWRRAAVVQGWGPVVLTWVAQGVVALDAAKEPKTWGPEPYVDLVAAGSIFAVRSASGEVSVWEWRDGVVSPLWSAEAVGAGALAVLRSGAAAAGVERGVAVFAADGARSILPVQGRVTALAFSPGGDLLAVGLLDGTLQVWGVDGESLLLEHPGHDGRLAGLAFRGESELITAGWDRVARRWDLGGLPR
ncbi:MAG: protein kinase [Deltaproteobacteria bacterium]|nr:protein kinase [Deltaproteobacteria bacterium]